jgi:hypothetical protein
VGYTCLRQQGPDGREGGCHRRRPSFDVWERSPDREHQKCPEDDAGVSRVGYRVDLVGSEHESSEVGSQHDPGRVDAVMYQKHTPDNAVDWVVDRHDGYKEVTVTAGGEKGNCVL